MRNFILLAAILVLHFYQANAQGDNGIRVYGSTQSIPETTYEYGVTEPAGITRNYTTSNLTCKVENGRIKDANGNFFSSSRTLTNVSVCFTPFYVQWDNSSYTDSKFGSISFYDNGELLAQENNIEILPRTMTIKNVVVSNNKNYEYPVLVFDNVVIKKGATVGIKGYEAVRLLPGSKVEAGSNVRIYIGKNENMILSSKTDIAESSNTSEKIYLQQNTPNPFKDQTLISCNVPESAKNSRINIYNTTGYLVKSIILDASGNNDITLDGSVFKPGIYFYSLIVDNQLVESKKMIIKN